MHMKKLELSYVCTVNTDELMLKDQINNTVTTSSGDSDTDRIEVDYPLDLEKKGGTGYRSGLGRQDCI